MGGVDIPSTTGTASLDEPTVVMRGGRRTVYMSWIDGADRFIGRAGPGPGMHPLSFSYASIAMRPQFAWEQGAVQSPDATLDGNDVVMVYAAGGAIGFARSTDGTTFTARSEPILTAERDPMRGNEGAALTQPSIARAPTGEWLMAYASDARIFLARAPRPEGPWERMDAEPGGVRDPIVSPASSTVADAGGAFEMVSVGDPVLVVLQTAIGRTSYRVFYTATGPAPATTIGAAASFDVTCPGATAMRPCFSRVPQPVFAVSGTSLRAGSFDRVSDRIGLLWVGSGSAPSRTAPMPARRINAGVSPADLDLLPWVPRDQ